MRLGSIYKCPACYQPHPAIDVECARCAVAIVDEHGQTAPSLVSKVVREPRPATSLGKITARAAVGGIGLAAWSVIAPGGAAFLIPAGIVLMMVLVLAQIIVDRMRMAADRVAIAADRAQASLRLRELQSEHPLLPIGELPAEHVGRVRGRVKLLDAAPYPAKGGDPAVAAVLYESTWRKLGKFLIVDDSGEAMLDDDAVELWSERAPGDQVIIWDGDVVEVVGRGRYHRIGQEVDGYRGGKEITRFVFEGEHEAPLHILKVDVPKLG